MRRLLVVTICLGLVLVGVTAGMALSPGDGPVHVCAKRVGDRVMRLVDGPEACKKTEAHLTLASYDDLAALAFDLQTQIDVLAGRVGAVEVGLSDEVADRVAADAALQTQIDALAGRLTDLEGRVDALENPPEPPLPDAVAYWSFDDQADPTADGADGHDADVVGAVFESTDIAPLPGNVAALRFNGTSDYAWTPDPGGADNLDGFAEMTLAAWVNPDVVSSPWDSARIILSKYDTQDTNSISYWLLLRNDEVEVFVARQRVVNEDRLRSTGVDLVPGEWRHVAGTWDGVELKLYVDGTLVASKLTSVASMDDSELQVDIGAAEKVVSFGGRAGFFDGLLDEVYIFDRALTETEIGLLAAG